MDVDRLVPSNMYVLVYGACGGGDIESGEADDYSWTLSQHRCFPLFLCIYRTGDWIISRYFSSSTYIVRLYPTTPLSQLLPI